MPPCNGKQAFQGCRKPARRREADLCEATEGFAVVWRREGWGVRDMVRWADGDMLTLLTLVRWLRAGATRCRDEIMV